MSNTFDSILVYSGLPSGGALEIFSLHINFLSKKFRLKVINEPKYRIRNFIEYLFTALFKSKEFGRRIVVEETAVLIAYSSWLVKAPYILRYFKQRKIYICHEPPREFYDKNHVRIQSVKERLINLLRIPIRIADYNNVKASHASVVANSHFSKKLIDETYNINSVVIHPGIETSYFTNKGILRKKHQVISVGAINTLKRQTFFVDVLSKISEPIRPELVLVGNGCNQDYLVQILDKAKKLNVSVRVLLNVTKEKLLNELHMSKVFLFAPIAEPFGIVVEEAIASGLPIQVYKYGGGYAELLVKKNGNIVDNLDPENWAKKLELLLSNDVLREKISQYNSVYASVKFNSNIMNIKLLKLIKKL